MSFGAARFVKLSYGSYIAASIAVDALQRVFPCLSAAYIFGSRVSGHATTQSDWDVAILLAGGVEPLQL